MSAVFSSILTVKLSWTSLGRHGVLTLQVGQVTLLLFDTPEIKVHQ